MTDTRTGRRTFFHLHGANALLAPADFDFTGTRARIFHLGYLLLLDRLDRMENGRPCAFDVLKRARDAGMLTSLDCVSENSDRFAAVLKPVLPQVDILFVNDFEAEKITGLELRAGAGGAVRRPAVEQAAESLIGHGVHRCVVLHFPEAVYALERDGHGVWQPSLRVPREAIRGTAGAGDALAAGVLYGIHETWSMGDSLRLGVCVAAASLADASCSEGVRKVDECLALEGLFGLLSMPE
jgi:sugar/nucleoside kinase (ribokinase family)